MFAKQKYIPDDSVAARYAALPRAAADWLAHRRDEAVKTFAGYPSAQVEQWKFTNVKPLLALQAEDARPNQGDISRAAAKLDALPVGPRVVFVNGAFHTALSNLPQQPGVQIGSLTHMLAEQPQLLEAYLGRLSMKDAGHGFAQANLALAQDGLAVRLEEGVELEQPLIVGHIHTGGSHALHTHTRHVVILKAGSRMQVIEMSIGVPNAVYAANSTTEIFLGGGAKLTHVWVQEESEQAGHIASRYVYAEKRSRFCGIAFTTGARVNRVETQVELGGIEAHAEQHTVQLLRGNLHSDSTTHIIHNTPDATSTQHCRMILDDAAKGAFQGKTTVRRDAQRTDARQLNKNLLLSRHAVVDSKPELEIYADDVKCSHGATTGELDAMALFYLESRGMDRATAKRLLVEAFADHVIDDAPLDGEMKNFLRSRVAGWMGREDRELGKRNRESGNG